MLRAGFGQSFETGLAAYLAVRNLAEGHLRAGRNVVVDAVNGVELAREMWRSLAQETNARLMFVEVVCSDRTEHRRRVESRPDTTPPVPLPSWAEVSRHKYAAWVDPVLRVDSVNPTRETISRIQAALAALADRAGGPEKDRGTARADRRN